MTMFLMMKNFIQSLGQLLQFHHLDKWPDLEMLRNELAAHQTPGNLL